LQNLAELLSYALTAVFSRPAQFEIPVFVSTAMALLAAALYAAFVRRRRGHLIHMSSCMDFKAIHPRARCGC
jgi:solute carrier family 40 (iron-regulated transporter), member 1